MTADWQPSCSLGALQARAQLLADLRTFFAQRDVLEVQTALLARHTVTEPNIDSMTVGSHGYLQTSPEYQLKRLLAAGAPSIYQLGSVFRAGELGRLHNPEFTLLEWYRLGFDDEQLMAEVAELVNQVLGADDYGYHRYQDLVGDLERSPEVLDLALVEALEALGPGRHFITHYPAEQAALARLHPDEPRFAARFELVVDGVELANGYHELTDAEEQRRRFASDIERRRQAGKAELDIDERFLAALDAGLPDCAGVALGVDRLLMLQQGATSLAEIMPFPADRA
jgi:lysyl-tRNA synthetase class 2